MIRTQTQVNAGTALIERVSRTSRRIALVLFTLYLPIHVRADVITDLNDRARIATGRDPRFAGVEMAYVHAAIYDAVNGIDGRFRAYAVNPSSVPAGSSKEAAAIAAAYTVLIARLPLQAALLTADENALLAGIPDSPGKTSGIAIGIEVGNGILALRTGDGQDSVPPPYVFGSGSGAYQQIPIFQPRVDPVLQNLASMRPFTLLSPAQFRAKGPPVLTSHEWAAGYNEVKSRGAKDSSTRTPAETQLAISYTENPINYYTRIFRNVSAAHHLSLEDNARFFAMLHLGYADAIIAVFESKYHYSFWRPYTAIHAGDTDGNPLTGADPIWVPLAVTPGHPEYPAAHGAASGCIAEILRTFFGTKKITIAFTPVVPGYTAGEITHHSTDDMIRDVIEGRILGGMHYRTSGRDGTIMGRKVADWLTKHTFRPIDEDEDEDHEGDDEEGRGGQLVRTKSIDGDSNGDGAVDLSDAVSTLGYLFIGTGETPDCLRASDANDDGQVDISDALYTLNFLFQGGPAPLPTFPEAAAEDPFADRLGCAAEAP